MLGDGIYEEWSIFVLPNHAPLYDRELHMTKRHEGVSKDVERFLDACKEGLRSCGKNGMNGATAN